MSMNFCVAPMLKNRSCRPNIRILPRPHAHMQRELSSRFKPTSLATLFVMSPQVVVVRFWSTAVLRAFRLLPRCASVAVVYSPKFNLDMIVHSFTSMFSKTFVQYPDTCVLPHADCVSQRMWSTMPTTCWFGLQTTPMSEIPLVIDCAAYRLLSKKSTFAPNTI